MNVDLKNNNSGELATRKRNLTKANLIHLNFVDDFSIAEAVNMTDILTAAPVTRIQPDTYHARTGHILKPEKSHVYNQLMKTANYAKENQMLINEKKTKLMVFNPCISLDFTPEFNLNGKQLEVVEEMKILGLIIRSDLSWKSNTEQIVSKAYKKL